MNNFTRFISQSCATYDSDGNCHLETNVNGDRTCVYFREQGGRCLYAENFVIPGNERIEMQYWLERGLAQWNEGAKTCKSCNQLFKPTGNRQAYCTTCGQERARKKRNERNREYRVRRASK